MRLIVALGLVVGCSGGSDQTPTFSGVQVIDQDTLENHVYYIDLSVADTPLTVSELNDPEGAIPVRLLAGEDFVIAIGLDPVLGPEAMDRVMGTWKLSRDLDTTKNDDDAAANSAPLLVDWDQDVSGIEDDELDVLVRLHPGCF